jgi:nucleolar protein 56
LSQENFILYEMATGYALFARLELEEIGSKLDAVQRAVDDFEGFSKTVRLKAFVPFESAAQALENARAVAEGQTTSDFIPTPSRLTLAPKSKNYRLTQDIP